MTVKLNNMLKANTKKRFEHVVSLLNGNALNQVFCTLLFIKRIKKYLGNQMLLLNCFKLGTKFVRFAFTVTAKNFFIIP